MIQVGGVMLIYMDGLISLILKVNKELSYHMVEKDALTVYDYFGIDYLPVECVQLDVSVILNESNYYLHPIEVRLALKNLKIWLEPYFLDEE